MILHRGRFLLLERAVSNLAPLYSSFGLWESRNGFNFRRLREEPVFTAAQLGTPFGTVEDPRLVRYGDWFYMTYVHRNFASSCHPTGKGIPRYTEAVNIAPGDPNHYRSGIARSRDLVSWEDMGLVTPREVDDRDCVLFPEKIAGRYAMLRRPMHYVGADYGCDSPSIWLSYSDNLRRWDKPVLVARTANTSREGGKIGAAAPPLRTRAGWLVLYHGVDDRTVYRTGAMLLDLKAPERVIARTPDFFFEPEEWYEKVGLIIPRVVFPSATVVKDGTLYVYYGCCDTVIAVATCNLGKLLAHILKSPAR